VLKVGQGELVSDCGTLIKAGRESGTHGAVLVLDPMVKDASTGFNYHREADEFFYVLPGSGSADIDGQTYQIESGDVIFIPAGHDHRAVAKSEGLEVLIFLDKPGLDDEFRGAHRRFDFEGESFALEELNKIANKYGTVYKTLK